MTMYDAFSPRRYAWEHWIDLYCETWCVGRNLQTSTIRAYRDTLRQFEQWLTARSPLLMMHEVKTRTALDYVVYLREERKNGDSAINRVVVVLKNFYHAMTALGHLAPSDNPMDGFPKMKKGREKLPSWLSEQEVRQLLATPKTETVLGLRDRAILSLLYATGVRANECASVLEEWIDLDEKTVRVLGKGNRERVIALNVTAVQALKAYRQARGPIAPRERFFRKKDGGPVNRKIVYERVKKHARDARITKRVSPHVLRHTCATHLVKRDVNLVVLRDILGHRHLSSTQIYLHTTAKDMREVARNHPIAKLAPTIEEFIEAVKLPIDYPPRRRIVASIGVEALPARASPRKRRRAG